MAAFQFPASPIIDQVFEPVPGTTYKWNGTGWVLFSNAYMTTAEVSAAIAAALSAFQFGTLAPVFTGMIAYLQAIPAGWLPCQGQTISKTTYASLWAFAQNFLVANHTTNPGGYIDQGGDNFAVPQLFQGDFIRTGGGSSAGIGVGQVESTGNHSHGVTDSGHSHAQTSNDAINSHQQTASGPSAGTGFATATQIGGAPIRTETVATGIAIQGNNPGGENYPRNVALYACVFTGKFA